MLMVGSTVTGMSLGERPLWKFAAAPGTTRDRHPGKMVWAWFT